MLRRRHLPGLVLPVTAARAPATALQVAPAAAALTPWLRALARRVATLSGGACTLVPGPGGAVLGSLGFGPVSLGAALEPFAGFPFGMGAGELAHWLGTADGAALWRSGFALRGLHAWPCAIIAFPGLVEGGCAPEGSAELGGLRLECRGDGVLGLGLRDCGAVPVAGGGAARLAMPPGGAGWRLCPPFGTVLELALPAAAIAELEPHVLAVLRRASADTLAASMRAPLPTSGSLPAAAAILAGRMAARLGDCLGAPEAVELRVAERYAAARLAAMRAGAWG
ncbi:hypothetical protein ACFQU2_03710 [Siccirubricoccus deserti]|uniref:Uncharacterized protein n=1 Tax=Siccirubricoccus deserti TaxID=2013562 RepID=A0A9X0R0W3_9PROT|nr:hypothetical protein [Siccirubricoccus deserti]MBC4016292.1 hypothetical protein [Siccirubricoccus deserti]